MESSRFANCSSSLSSSSSYIISRASGFPCPQASDIIPYYCSRSCSPSAISQAHLTPALSVVELELELELEKNVFSLNLGLQVPFVLNYPHYTPPFTFHPTTQVKPHHPYPPTGQRINQGHKSFFIVFLEVSLIFKCFVGLV